MMITITSVRVDKDLVKFLDEKGNELFSVARDSMGTQICNHGYFYPDKNTDFGSIEKALNYIKGKEEEIVNYFKNPTSEPLSLLEIMAKLYF